MRTVRQSRVGVIAHEQGDTNGVLVDAWRADGILARLVAPSAALRLYRAGDTVLVRLDVRRRLDGIEPGLDAVRELECRGCRVLNSANALVGVHDKLLTARLLEQARIPQPRTAHIATRNDRIPLEPPVVVKPRFGSWGRDIFLCATRAEVAECLEAVEFRPWFRSGGALVQELIPPRHVDLRLLVAGGKVVGSAQRNSAPDEWRTNVSLGGRLLPMIADAGARALGVRAAAAVGADLVAIDLLPSARGWIVLELNGAADFDDTYSWTARNVFADVADALDLRATPRPLASSSVRPRGRREAAIPTAAAQ